VERDFIAKFVLVCIYIRHLTVFMHTFKQLPNKNDFVSAGIPLRILFL
jgi:hypothetical protein